MTYTAASQQGSIETFWLHYEELSGCPSVIRSKLSENMHKHGQNEGRVQTESSIHICVITMRIKYSLPYPQVVIVKGIVQHVGKRE